MSFWKSIKTLNRNRLSPVNSVDNISGEGAIAEVWREHYESILNCVDQRKYTNKVTTTLCNTKVLPQCLHIGYLPKNLIDSVIIPPVKNKNCILSDKEITSQLP